MSMDRGHARTKHHIHIHSLYTNGDKGKECTSPQEVQHRLAAAQATSGRCARHLLDSASALVCVPDDQTCCDMPSLTLRCLSSVAAAAVRADDDEDERPSRRVRQGEDELDGDDEDADVVSGMNKVTRLTLWML